MTEATLADLKPDPRNARRHNPRNIGMIVDSLHQVGAARSIVIDEDNVILAGNGVIEAAAEAGIMDVRIIEASGNEIIAVKRSGLTAEQKTKLALFDNRTAELADWDLDVLGDLDIDLGDLFFDSELAEMGIGLDEPTNNPDAFTDIADDFEGAFMLKPDMKFQSDEPFGIPPLRGDRLLSVDDIELWPGDDLADNVGDGTLLFNYSSSCRKLDWTRAIMAFYVDDVKFESVWARPDQWATKIINSSMLGCVSPNYSLWFGQAQAVHIWQTYRSRWVARYFQEAGISIIPDVNWSTRDDYEFCFAGIPEGAPLISIQVQTFNSSDASERARVAEGISEALIRLRPQRVLFYASKAGRELIAEVVDPAQECLVLSTYMDLRRGKLRKEIGHG